MMWNLLLVAALAFPDIAARDLDGHAASVRQLAGAPAVLAIGLSYDSRHDVEPWTKWLVEATHGKLPVIVMPVYGPIPGLVRDWIDHSMASHVPSDLRGHVWTTLDRAAIVKALDLDANDRAAIVLLDAQGRIRYVACGKPTEASERELLAQWRAIAP